MASTLSSKKLNKLAKKHGLKPHEYRRYVRCKCYYGKMSIITMLETALTYKRLGVDKNKYDDINWYMTLMVKDRRVLSMARRTLCAVHINDIDIIKNDIDIIKNALHDPSKVMEFDTLKYGTLPRPIHKSWAWMRLEGLV